jgi:hypothetical protein
LTGWPRTDQQEDIVAAANPLRVELGQKLRVLRERAGIASAGEVDADPELGWYPGKTSKVETGTRVPVDAEINRLAKLYRLSTSEHSDLRRLAKLARKRVQLPHVADWAQSYVLLEQAAAELDYFDEVLPPALFQPEEYARDLLSQGGATDLEMRVAERTRRANILHDPDGPHLRVVLGEGALHRLPADPPVARKLLEHLVTCAQLDRVSIRILPFAAGLHPLVGINMTVVRLAEPRLVRVYLEGATTATYIHEPDETAVYEGHFETVRSRAATETESVNMLRRHIQRFG